MEVESHYCGGGFQIDELATSLGKLVNLNDSDVEDENQELKPYELETVEICLEKSATSQFPVKSSYELATRVGKLLNLKDDDVEAENEEPYGLEPVEICLEKSATSPFPGNSSVTLLDDNDKNPETALPSLFREDPMQCSVPVPKLVSAMKGSRGKLVAEPRKLCVKWAPDVYDPIPNSLSHTVKGKSKKSRKDKYKNNHSKKNGKKGHKGSSSRVVVGNNKQHSRKLAGVSNQWYRPMDAYEPKDDHDGFEVGSSDYCASVFLRTSHTNFHYSVAEAL